MLTTCTASCLVSFCGFSLCTVCGWSAITLFMKDEAHHKFTVRSLVLIGWARVRESKTTIYCGSTHLAAWGAKCAIIHFLTHSTRNRKDWPKRTALQTAVTVQTIWLCWHHGTLVMRRTITGWPHCPTTWPVVGHSYVMGQAAWIQLISTAALATEK